MRAITFNKLFWKDVTKILLKVILISLIISTSIYLLQGLYRFGYSIGFNEGQENAQEYYDGLFEDLAAQRIQLTDKPVVIISGEPESASAPQKHSLISSVGWGGPELWEAVNKKRQERCVNPLNQADELCTIASIRLNELLALGTLDGHEGFSNLSERRSDLEWIFEKYSTVAEFLLAGADTPDEAVSLWENTLAHKKLLTGGEYVWGCIYAQNSFAVAITAY